MRDGSTQEQDNGKLVDRPSDGNDTKFGAPGPFTRWTIDATNSDWSGLPVDATSVNEGLLERTIRSLAR